MVSLFLWALLLKPLGALENELIAEAVAFTISSLIFVNIAWTILNLMPVLPLDGGRVCDIACRAISPGKGPLVARWIGVVVSALVAFAAFRFTGSVYAGMLFVMFGVLELSRHPKQPVDQGAGSDGPRRSPRDDLRILVVTSG